MMVRVRLKNNTGRPRIFSLESMENCKAEILYSLKDCPCFEGLDDLTFERVFSVISREKDFDGYRLMKKIEDISHRDGSTQDVLVLDEIEGIVEANYQNDVKEWVKDFGITIPCSVGDTVEYMEAFKRKKGRVLFLLHELAQVSVVPEEDGEGGVLPLVNVENLFIEVKEDEQKKETT